MGVEAHPNSLVTRLRGRPTCSPCWLGHTVNPEAIAARPTEPEPTGLLGADLTVKALRLHVFEMVLRIVGVGRIALIAQARFGSACPLLSRASSRNNCRKLLLGRLRMSSLIHLRIGLALQLAVVGAAVRLGV